MFLDHLVFLDLQLQVVHDFIMTFVVMIYGVLMFTEVVYMSIKSRERRYTPGT